MDPPLSTVFDIDHIRHSSLVASLDFHPEISSTNDQALRLAEIPGTALPALVLADRQTAGRGRRTNRWWSDEGALTFSLVVDAVGEGIRQSDFPLVSLATALGVGVALEALLPGESFALKWPNDVYLAQRKVCGILLEVSAQAPSRLVLGIGVNVNNSLLAAPPDVRDRAIALCDVTALPLNLTGVLLGITAGVLDEISCMKRGDLHLKSRWQPRCMLHGRTVRVDMGLRSVRGGCLGIDDQGALLVQDETGLHRCLAGVVSSIA